MSAGDHSRGTDAAGTGGRLGEITEFVGRVVELAGFDLTTEARVEGETLIIELNGPDGPLLFDRRGELLEALQVVLTKMLPRRFGVADRILVDSAGYRLGREREIADGARLTAERVKRLGEPCELSPMNPYERRIVHLALSSDHSVTTASAGEGFLKRVTIYPSHPQLK